jgi:hypothetical protein
MQIKTASFNCHLTAREPFILPAYKGSTLREEFGYAFNRVVRAIPSLPSTQFNELGIQI